MRNKNNCSKLAKEFIIVSIVALLISCSNPPSKRNSYNAVRTNSAIIFIDSQPQGATITLDGNVIGATPLSYSLNYSYQDRGYHPDENIQRTIKVSKIGYKDHSTNFTIQNRAYKNIPRPILLEREIDRLVSVTGAASGLERLTVGGAHERVSDISNDNNWLLIDAKETLSSNAITVIEKLGLHNGYKVVLTTKNSSSKDAVWLPNDKKFIFSSNRLGGYSLVESLGVTGESGVRFLTEQSLGAVTTPSYSVNNEIVFTVRNNGQNSIGITNENGKNLRLFSNGKSPNWSPNGKKIVFIRNINGYNKLFVFEPISGGNMIQLTDDLSNDSHPEWSIDGQKIAFISDRVGGSRHIFVYNLLTRNVTQLTDGQFDVSSVVWGKNNHLYFSANAGENWDVWKLIYKN